MRSHLVSSGILRHGGSGRFVEATIDRVVVRCRACGPGGGAQLEARGRRVTVVEARDRVGGRVQTVCGMVRCAGNTARRART